MTATWDWVQVLPLRINSNNFLNIKTVCMKKTIIVALTLLLGGLTTFAQSKHDSTMMHKQHHMTSTKKYTCSMHPEVVMNKPGKCPKCGMALVPMKAGKKGGRMKGEM